MLTAFSYIYDTTGRKVRKVVRVHVLSQNTVTDYAHGFQYENNILQFFPTAEGYVSRLTTKIDLMGRFVKIPIEELPEDQFSYVYNYTDHLGNIRLSYAQDPDTQQLKIVEQNHYYPFGLRHTNYSGGKMQVVKDQEFKRMAPTPEELLSYKYKYNGKEWQDELGLNLYDYGARNYDAALGRWMNVDPLAEKYQSISSFSYVANCPLLFIDPNGKEIIVVNKVDQEKVLKMINSQAVGTFDFDKNGKLYLAKSGGDTSKFSQYYTDRLVQAIGEKEKIIIQIAPETVEKDLAQDGVSLVDKPNGAVIKVAGNGEGLTQGGWETDQLITISGNGLKNDTRVRDSESKMLEQSPADILMHELVGHAIPRIAGSDTGDAVWNENKVREQLNKKKRDGTRSDDE